MSEPEQLQLRMDHDYMVTAQTTITFTVRAPSTQAAEDAAVWFLKQSGGQWRLQGIVRKDLADKYDYSQAVPPPPGPNGKPSPPGGSPASGVAKVPVTTNAVSNGH